jgi:hypothetical protein
MAYVRSLAEVAPPERGRPHKECDAGWFVAERHGQRVLQIDTYGSQARKDVGTVSQSLQLDEARSAELVEVLLAAFPDLRRRLVP